MNDNTEQTVQEYITSLNTDKQTLVNNLTTKGVSASNEETFTTLVPKVLDIDSGGGDPNKTVFMTTTVEEMNGLTTMKDGDMCLVYSNNLEPVIASSQFQTAYFPKKVVLSSAVQDMIYCSYTTVESSLRGHGQLQVSATDMRFMFSIRGEPGSEFFVDIEYTSTDGINYTRTDTNSPFVDFTTLIELSNQEEWNDLFGNFIKIGDIQFLGIYEYGDNKWSYAVLNLPLTSQEVYPDVKGYSDNGVITGDMGKNIQNGYNFIKLNDLVANIDTSLVTSLEGVFQSNSSEYIPITVSMDTSNVTSMINSFADNPNLKSVDLRNWNTNKVEDFFYIFRSCSNLSEILGIENIVTASANNLSGFFSGCVALPEINMSNWDTSNVTNFDEMFDNLSVGSINIKPLNFVSATSIVGMFQNLTNLTSIEANEGQIVGTKEKAIDIGRLFSYCSKLTSMNLNFLSGYFCTDFGNSIFRNCSELQTVDLSSIKIISGSYTASFANMFNGCSKLTTIIGLDTLGEDITMFSTSTDLTYMFANCTSLETISISNWQNCTLGGSLFNFCYGCSSLTSANLQSINGSIEAINGAFNGCTSLTSLDLRNADLSTITYSHKWSDAFTGVPDNCEIIVKDEASKNAILSHYSNLTNIKLVSELTA